MLERSSAPFERFDDLRFQERQWAVQRMAWAVFFGFVVAAAIGFFGHGLVGQTQGKTPALEVRYNRLQRVSDPDTLELTVRKANVKTREVEVWFSRAFIAGARLDQINPEPRATRLEGDRVYYTFEARGDSPQQIQFEMEFDRMGIKQGLVGLSNGETLELRHWVYP